MGRKSAWIIWATAIFALAGGFAGCRSPTARWGESDNRNPRENGQTVDLTPYLTVPLLSHQTYLQRNPTEPGDAATRYDRKYEPAGRVEGSLIGRVEWPLERYFDPHSNRPDRPRVAWPTGEHRAVEAFLIEFDPPMGEWPADIRSGEVTETSARMRAYDRWGIPFADGSARRWVRLGGVEEITVGGATFADCVRLEADTDLWFGWWAFVSLRETVWFARHVGVVRRIERITGNALLIFRFNSTHEYERVDGAASTNRLESAAGAARALPDRWARLAICLDRGVPHPRIGGLAVEWSGRSEHRAQAR